MSKFFFKGRIEIRQKYGGTGYQTNREEKPGTESYPLTLTVASDDRKADIEATLKEHELFANIEVNAEVAENLSELDVLLNKPTTQVLEKKPNRNDPCSCGSGKKYKKCCA